MKWSRVLHLPAEYSPHWQHHTVALRERAGRWRNRAPAATSPTSDPQLCSQPRSNHSHGYWRGNLPDQNQTSALKVDVQLFSKVFYCEVLQNVFLCVLPYSSVCSTSGTQEDSQVSVKEESCLKGPLSLNTSLFWTAIQITLLSPEAHLNASGLNSTSHLSVTPVCLSRLQTWPDVERSPCLVLLTCSFCQVQEALSINSVLSCDFLFYFVSTSCLCISSLVWPFPTFGITCLTLIVSTCVLALSVYI